MDDILILLLRKGAKTRPVRMTTSEIGAEAGMSQQNASRRLAEMEQDGYIERGKEGIMMTPKGTQELAAAYSSLRQAFEGERLEMHGKVVKGSGEGKYYLSLSGYRKQIKDKLGFDPFPGTLNVMVDDSSMAARQQLRRMEPFVISGFKDGERTYGDLFAYKCRLETLECAIVIPLRTHHGADVIEIICADDIKKSLGKKDGDQVKVMV
jgi:riboflavin kinase, archaea type